MSTYIFNGTNLIILIVFAFFCFGFWMPYIKSKKYEGVIDSYCHPLKGDKRDVTFVAKIMYKEENGKRNYCYSKRIFDTQGEAMQLYPKNSKVRICVFHETKNDDFDQAMIISDMGDMRHSLFLTLAAVICCTALAFGFQLYQYYYGSQ